MVMWLHVPVVIHTQTFDKKKKTLLKLFIVRQKLFSYVLSKLHSRFCVVIVIIIVCFLYFYNTLLLEYKLCLCLK